MSAIDHIDELIEKYSEEFKLIPAEHRITWLQQSAIIQSAEGIDPRQALMVMEMMKATLYYFVQNATDTLEAAMEADDPDEAHEHDVCPYRVEMYQLAFYLFSEHLEPIIRNVQRALAEDLRPPV